MIDLIQRFFNRHSETLPRGIKKPRLHDIRIATCALFLEMANIDDEFSDAERDNIINTLKKDYDLSDEHAAELIRASEDELEGSIDLWKFTSLINSNYSIHEKVQIIELMWKIAYTDGRLDKHEDYLVHKLAELLRLSHKQLIDAKLKIVHGTAR